MDRVGKTSAFKTAHDRRPLYSLGPGEGLSEPFRRIREETMGEWLLWSMLSNTFVNKTPVFYRYIYTYIIYIYIYRVPSSTYVVSRMPGITFFNGSNRTLPMSSSLSGLCRACKWHIWGTSWRYEEMKWYMVALSWKIQVEIEQTVYCRLL